MSTAETFGRTIQLFLVDGKPTGLRKATIHGWTGPALRQRGIWTEWKVNGSPRTCHDWHDAQAGKLEAAE